MYAVGMPSKPTTVARYLASLPKDRRDAIQAVRKVIRANLDDGYAEGMQYGMIGYFVPHSVYPPGYHCDSAQPLPYVSIASQKNHMSIYLCSVYGSEDEGRWFREAWAKTGKKLDMGKSCVRFKTIDDLALDVIAKAIKRTPARKYIASYEAALGERAARKATRKTAKKPTTKKARKTTAAKATARKTTRKTTGRTKKTSPRQSPRRST